LANFFSAEGLFFRIKPWIEGFYTLAILVPRFQR
jgi:hypothetical protein